MNRMNHIRYLVSSTLLLSCVLLEGCQTADFAHARPVESALDTQPVAFTSDDSAIKRGESGNRSSAIAQTPPATENNTPLSYTFVEVGAMNYNVDNINGVEAEADNYYARGSLGLGLLHVFAGYENQDLDLQNTSSDLFRLGGGAHIELTEKLHAVGEVAWLYSDVSSNFQGFAESNSGYEIKAGARWMAVDWAAGGLELDGNLVWVDLENRLASDDRAFGWEAGLRIHLFEMLSAGAMYSVLEDDDQIAISARLSF